MTEVIENELEYHERRAREEMDAAGSSSGAQVASAHRLLAIEYEAQANELRSGAQRRPTLKLWSN